MTDHAPAAPETPPTPTPPPPAMSWTPNQAAAIEDRGHDLVVSASAGSGKTAVLTERVLRLITEPNPATGEPVARIEELLIITFTEKAARQMRERIEKRIRKELETNPESTALRAAYDGLASAWIMTIDAFCRRIVVENFHEAGVPPTPRIPDAAELAELERDHLNELLEDWAADPALREALADLIQSCARAADGLVDDLRKLIGFMQSLDRPDLWLGEARAAIEASLKAASYQELPETRAVQPLFKNSTRELADALREIAALAASRGAEASLAELWGQLAEQLEAITRDQYAFRPDALQAWLADDLDPVLAKLPLQKNCGKVLYKDDVFKKNFLERFSKHYARWRELWFALDEAGLLRGAQLAAAQSRAMLDLAEEAMERIERAKQRRGILTFNDFERLTLKVLTDPANPDAPSEIAHRLRRQFQFVLVDEYQDTSPLQDALVRRVARSDDPAEDGNLFLVGDIKQSIYRFRHAEPALFLEKMMAEASSGGRLRRINLHENFRSRPAILEFINHAFEGIMDRAVGELDYRGEERLKAGRVEPVEAPKVTVEVQWLPKDGAATSESVEADEGPSEEEGATGEGLELLDGLEAQAHWVARRIRELTDPENGLLIPEEAPPSEPNPPLRRALPGDCAILLRGIRGELEIWIQALEREGLKVRAPGVNPLFSTPEMIDLLSALRIADNPFQDIPLATLMRSPLGGFTDDELLRIRMVRRHGPFHGAVWAAAGRPLPEFAVEGEGGESGKTPQAEGEAARAGDSAAPLPEALFEKLSAFVARIDDWRLRARRSPTYELLGSILQETGYETYLMGRLDGLARIERLDFLRGLLLKLGRSDEGSNPLATFLEMIERAEADEGEVGELPESVAEHMDAVNILTVHRSKGLEFPIVFLPRLERAFRTRKPGETLFDREFGMTRSGVDVQHRRRYPTLAHRAMIDRLNRKDRSEEIRLLYVAMTRARERLILVAQPGKLDQLEQKWGAVLALGGRPAGALDRLHARCPADLVGPIVHWLWRDRALAWLAVSQEAEAAVRSGGDAATRLRELLAQIDAEGEGGAATADEAEEMLFLPTIDPAEALTRLPTKTAVTKLKKDLELKAQAEERADEDAARDELRFVEQEMVRPFFSRRGRLSERKPEWLEAETREAPARLGADRRGTLTHALLAHADLTAALSVDDLREQAERLIDQGLIGGPFEDKATILKSLPFVDLAWFFESELGQTMRANPRGVARELAFTASKDIIDFDPAAAAYFPTEHILVQGVIDAVIDHGRTVTVIDYKTDRVRDGEHLAELVKRYRFQITQYTRAIQKIWKLGEISAALVFLDAREIVFVEDED